MFLVKHYNARSIHWLIRKFETFQFTGSSLEERFIPRPDISIIFHFQDSPLILGEPPVRLEPFFAAPIVTQSMILSLCGPMDTFVVICKPTSFSRIFGLNLDSLKNRTIDLPKSIFSPVWKAMSGLKTTEERIEYFCNFINGFQKNLYYPDVIDAFYDKIVEEGTTMSLKEIIRDCCISQRTLERNFIRRTGVSPKTLMRVVRLDHLLTRIKNNNAIDYQDIVFEGNYFDQSHFINDFKAIIGETPSYFLKRNLDTVKMISGKTEGSI